LTQAFFAHWLERRDFEAARREKRRLRSYLPVSLKHFPTNERNKTRAAKRGRGHQPISLDEIIRQQRAPTNKLQMGAIITIMSPGPLMRSGCRAATAPKTSLLVLVPTARVTRALLPSSSMM